MRQREDRLSQAERLAREGEARVARMAALARDLERRGYAEAAGNARDLLAILEQSLDVARARLNFVRQHARRGPGRR